MQPNNSENRSTRALLTCGVICGPFFYLMVLAQMVGRAGFDIRRHPLSLLSLGSAGWIQMTNFIVTGVIAIGFAAGVRRLVRAEPAAMLAPLLLTIWGLGMIVAGIFPPDPAFGFPPGTSDGVPTVLSASAKLHGLGFFLAFGSLTIACFVFARRFRVLRHRGWSHYSIATGIVTPALVVLGMAVQRATSLLFAIDGLVAFGWVAAVAMQLIVVRGPSMPNGAIREQDLNVTH